MAKDITSYFLEKGEPLLPKPKPRYTESLKVLETPAAKKMFYPESLQYMKDTLQQKAYQNKEITTSDYYEMIKPQSMEPKLVDGRIEFKDGGDYWSMVTRMFVEAGSEKGTGMNINDFAAMYFPRDQKSDGGRIGFADGPPGKKGGNYNPTGINQFTDKMKSIEQIKNIINSQPNNWTAKDFRGEGKLNNKDMGKDFKGKLLTRDDLKRAEAEGIKPYTTGKRRFITDDPSAKERGKFITAQQGSEMSSPKKSGYNVSHLFPKVVGTGDVTSKSLMIEKESINRGKEGFDKAIKKITKEQKRLVDEQPKNWKYKLIQQNFLAAQTAKLFKQELGNKVKGTLGYFTVNPDTLKFNPKGVDLAKTIGGVYGEPTVYKTMTDPERKNVGIQQTKVQNVIDFVKSKVKGADITRASNIRVGGGTQEQVKDPLGGPDLINVKKFNNNPYDDDL